MLEHLVGLVDHLYLFGPQRRRPHGSLDTMIAAPRWADVLRDLVQADAA